MRRQITYSLSQKTFVAAVETGIEAAEAGAIITFGVVPDCPHTGYGYIETDRSNSAVFDVKRFVERPSQEAADLSLFVDGRALLHWRAPRPHADGPVRRM